jgi:hypothetical protein
MQTAPDTKDIDVELIAYADGHSTTGIRTVHNSMVPLAFDCALLYSQTSLGLRDYPTPGRSHNPPHDTLATNVPMSVALLSYNSIPSSTELRDRYPNTRINLLSNAIRDLWINRLSYATGSTSTASFDIDAIYHRISSLAGSSGGAILDSQGNFIGNFFLSDELTDEDYNPEVNTYLIQRTPTDTSLIPPVVTLRLHWTAHI